MAHLHLLLSAMLALASIKQELNTNKSLELNEESWLTFKRDHNKAYESETEEQFRKFIFFGNQIKVDKLNAENGTAKFGINHFADWSEQEVQSMFTPNTLNAPIRSNSNDSTKARPLPHQIADDSDELDYRKIPDKVSSVKDQGKCACGWAFAAAGAIEAHLVDEGISDELVDLSAQQFVDCFGGCTGTTSEEVFIHSRGGINAAASYPYTGVADKCKFKKDKAVVGVSCRIALLVPDEKVMQRDLQLHGPAAVTFDANGLVNYESGVFTGPCDGKMQHTALLVGYGHDKEANLDYWIVKNSWGEKWGEKGYMRIARNMHNTCNIASASVHPSCFTSPKDVSEY